MVDLVVRPSGLPAPKDWVLQLRFHDSVGPTEYSDVAFMSEEKAKACVEAGGPFYLFGDPAKAPPPPEKKKKKSCGK
jgi:hypothetical protein